MSTLKATPGTRRTQSKTVRRLLRLVATYRLRLVAVAFLVVLTYAPRFSRPCG